MAERENAEKKVLELDEQVAAIEPGEVFVRACEEYGIELEAGDLVRLGRYVALLLQANEQINLTAITELDGEQGVWMKHVFDALTLLPMVQECADEKGNVKLVDVGSGGGVPGLVLASVLSNAKLTLVEATGKKCVFLTRAAEILGLDNVRVVQGRAETLGAFKKKTQHRAGELREVFDVATVRAVGHLAIIAELTSPLVRVGGLVLAVKGERAEQELVEAGVALQTLNLSEAGCVRTPTGTVVVLEKVAPTPRTYPRREGEPKRAPIGRGKRQEARGRG